MSIKAYASEKFEKNTRRYIIFSVVFATIFILSILNGNYRWAILLFFLLGAYFYYSVTNNQIIKITIQENNLLVGDKVYPRNSLAWYAIEIDPKIQTIKNIVLVTRSSHAIHTVHDSKENIREFVLELNNYITQLSEYNQGMMEKIARRCKL